MSYLFLQVIIIVAFIIVILGFISMFGMMIWKLMKRSEKKFKNDNLGV